MFRVMRAAVIAILAALAAGLTAAAATNAPPDDAELMAASTRFALTATNDPAYNEALAAYCRLIRARIEGMPKIDPWFFKDVSRGSISRTDYIPCYGYAVVGRGWWKVIPENEIYVLDDRPFWNLMDNYNHRVCGRGVLMRSYDKADHFALIGMTPSELDAAAAGQGLPVRQQEESEFPPTGGALRKTDLPFQYDAWLPGGCFRHGELIPVFTVLRNRLDSPGDAGWWINIYYDSGDFSVPNMAGPDGEEAKVFGVYQILGEKRRRVPPRSETASSSILCIPHVVMPPRGALVYVMLLNGYNISEPGEYEIWATHPGYERKSSSGLYLVDPNIPAPPVRFRILPPWYETWGGRALLGLPALLLLAAAGFVLRRRRARPEPTPRPSSS